MTPPRIIYAVEFPVRGNHGKSKATAEKQAAFSQLLGSHFRFLSMGRSGSLLSFPVFFFEFSKSLFMTFNKIFSCFESAVSHFFISFSSFLVWFFCVFCANNKSSQVSHEYEQFFHKKDELNNSSILVYFSGMQQLLQTVFDNEISIDCFCDFSSSDSLIWFKCISTNTIYEIILESELCVFVRPMTPGKVCP